MHKHTQPKGLTPTESTRVFLGLFALFTPLAFADTVYRCGEAYSTSPQCGNTAATEVNPSSVRQATVPDQNKTTSQALREAQDLKNQRLQAERHAVQTTPIPQSAVTSSPTPAPQVEPVTHQRKKRHAHPSPSPYFIATAPKASPQKKSTAQAVPTVSPSSP